MFGNPAAERAAIEMTYEDTATISRTETTTGSNNITKTVPVVKYSEIDYDAVLFAAPDLLVLPGDSVSLKRFGRMDPTSQRVLTFQVVGRPAVYATHQEIRVKDGDLA